MVERTGTASSASWLVCVISFRGAGLRLFRVLIQRLSRSRMLPRGEFYRGETLDIRDRRCLCAASTVLFTLRSFIRFPDRIRKYRIFPEVAAFGTNRSNELRRDSPRL